MSAPAAAARFNPLRPDVRADPYPTYRRLREASPVHRTMGAWLLTRYDDVRAVLRDRTTSAGLVPDQLDRAAVSAGHADAGRLGRLARSSLVFTDDPAHARLRALVHGAITPRAVAALRPRIAEQAARLWGATAGEGTVDVVADLAAPLPYAVLADWLDLPAELAERMPGWTHDVRFLLDPGVLAAAEYRRLADVVDTVVGALAHVVAHRRRRPGQGLLDALLAARTRDGDALGDEEVAFVALMCFVAGGETTTALIANTVLALLRHPGELARYRDDPARRPGAVTETLRWDAPLQMTKRAARHDTVLGGQEIHAGETLLLGLAAAHRDPAAFDDPDAFRIDREPAHLGFGLGMHGCLGAALAREQAEVAVALVLGGTGPVALADADVPRDAASLIVRAPARLSVIRGRARC